MGGSLSLSDERFVSDLASVVIDLEQRHLGEPTAGDDGRHHRHEAWLTAP